MKRSKAFALFGVIALGIVAYSAWCGRTFYLKPHRFDGDVNGIPKEVMQTVREWNETQDVFGPPAFDWSHFLWLLRHPYDSEPEPIRIRLNGGYHLIDHPGIFRYPEVTEVLVNENWKDGHQMMIVHKTLGEIPAADFKGR